MLIDPYGEGRTHLTLINKALAKRRLVALDVDTRCSHFVSLSCSRGTLSTCGQRSHTYDVMVTVFLVIVSGTLT